MSQLTIDLHEQARHLDRTASNEWVAGLFRKSIDRIEELERVCEKASSELSAWDGKASADQTTSIGYVVQILRVAVYPEAAKEATPK